MSKRYLVQMEDECPVCEGRRTYHHPLWARYREETYNQTIATEAQKQAWFAAQGYETVPEENVPCDFCDYTGRAWVPVDLVKALADLGIPIPARSTSA